MNPTDGKQNSEVQDNYHNSDTVTQWYRPWFLELPELSNQISFTGGVGKSRDSTVFIETFKVSMISLVLSLFFFKYISLSSLFVL